MANDERVGEFLHRPLTGEWPYVWLDATYLKVRQGGRIVPVAAIIAVAANTEGRREIIGLGIGPSEAFGRWPSPFWTEFLRSLRARGLAGVRLVISDAHTGLKAAIARVFEGGGVKRLIQWINRSRNGQRCRVHWMRNALAFAIGLEPMAPQWRTLPRPAHRRRRRDPAGLRPLPSGPGLPG